MAPDSPGGPVHGTHSPLCRALPVSRRRWVLLVRVALGGFLVESWAWRGGFFLLLCLLRLCACSEAVRAEILGEGARPVRLGSGARLEGWAGGRLRTCRARGGRQDGPGVPGGPQLCQRRPALPPEGPPVPRLMKRPLPQAPKAPRAGHSRGVGLGDGGGRRD